MNTKPRIPTLAAALLLIVFILAPAALFAQGTAFTYQGSLNDGANRAGGVYDLQFSIYTASSGPSLLAGPITNSATGVTNGIFTVQLDFGAGPFNGAPCWLEISVRSNGVVSFTTLTPRQQLTPTPYAITASNLTGTLPAAQLTGSLPSSQLSGSYSNAVNFTNNADQFSGHFSGDGSGLTSVNASALGGLGPNAFWQTTGNSNIVGQLNYLGTADSNAFELRVYGTRALRVEPDPRGLYAANLIGGYSNNAMLAFGGGNTIAGGGAPGIPNLVLSNSAGVFIGAGSANIIGESVFDAVITGGYGSSNLASDTVIAGGNTQLIQPGAHYSVIGGGQVNVIGSNAVYATIGGGFNNSNQLAYSTIAGGFLNLITTNQSYEATIGGGSYNVANNSATVIGGGYGNSNNATAGVIGGGYNNVANGSYSTIVGGANNESGGAGSFIGGGGYDNSFGFLGNQADGDASVIVGGLGNTIQSSAPYSFIGGGNRNVVQTSATWSVIGGGYTNLISFNAYASVIAGGENNILGSNAITSVIGGGYQNTNLAANSVIPGGTRNTIGLASFDSTVGGGGFNIIGTNAYESTIAGGVVNTISNNANAATISGGYGNAIGNFYSTIPGGYQNTALGAYSFAAGTQAKANTSGTFVWADAQLIDFNSTSANQFLIRAANGVGINKNNPATALDVNGTVTATAFSGSFNAGNLTGTLPNSVLSGTYSGQLTFSNPVNSFAGNGANLTSLNAGSISSGTLPNSVLSGTYTGQLTFNNALNSFTGNGANLTSLNAGNISSGSLADARLSANVALLNRSPQTFTGNNNFSGSIAMTDPTKTIQFPSVSGTSVPMMQMFTGGIANSDRMVIAHSTTYTNYGLQYQDSSDRFQFLSGGTSVLCVDLGAGRVGVLSPAPTDTFVVVNAHCDGTSWINACDRNLKEHFTSIDPEQVLAKVAAMPVTEWNYKNNTAQHLGPVAQDFYAQFNLGADDKSISTIDEGGVALAAIQGLNKKVEEQAAELKDRNTRIAALEKAMTELRTLVEHQTAHNQ